VRLPAGKDFMWQADATASGASKPNVHLWNPSAANTNLWIYRVIVSNLPTGSTMAGWSLGRKDTTLSGTPTYSASSALMNSAQSVTTISCTTDTSTTLTAASGFLALQKGMTINGTNITAGTRIASIESDTSLTMTAVGLGAGTQDLRFGASAARIAATTSSAAADGPSGLFRGVNNVRTNIIKEIGLGGWDKPIVLLAGDGLVCKAIQPGTAASAAGILSVTFFGREVPA
jgi:hypothetical protein